ncbi:MAG: hypothetical protein LBR08_03765 [Bacteroidales bacterium]|jgi:beta-galactosidase|nr:hypothetical protein [Bacteroidales bacterium]
MTGVAGYNSWGDRPQPRYSLFANRDYRWGFTPVAIKNRNEAEGKSKYRY